MIIVTAHYCDGTSYEEPFEDTGAGADRYASLVLKSLQGEDQTPLADSHRHIKQVAYFVNGDGSTNLSVRSDALACIHPLGDGDDAA